MLTQQEFDRVETLARNFRARMGIPDDLKPDMFDLLRRMKIAGELAAIVEAPPTALGDSAATFDPARNAITVGSASVTRQSRRDRFTYAHEIGHKLADHQHLRHRKNQSAEQFGRTVKDDEKVANAIAAAILVPEHLANVDQGTTAEELAEKFGVSMPMARLRLLDLQRRYRLRRGISRPTPMVTFQSAGTKAATKREFDTGDYGESMAEMAANARRWNR